MQDNMLNFHHGQLSSFYSHDTQLSPRLISSVTTVTHHAYQHKWQSTFSVFMAKVSIRQRELDIKVVTRFHKRPVSLAQAQPKSIAFSKKTSSESTRQRKREQGRGRGKPKIGESLFPSLGDGDDEALVLFWGTGLSI